MKCSLLNDTFPSSQSTMTPATRQSVPSISDGKGKIIKLHEFNDNTIIPLEVIDKMDVIEFIVSPRQDPECIFDAIIRDPFDLSEYFHNGKVNNLTIPMRQKIAHSIGSYEIPILPIHETRGALNNYYTSLQAQLTTYFDQNVSVYHVQPDSNCLYRSQSHIIFNTENCFDILKYSRTRLRRTCLGNKKKYILTEVRLIRMHGAQVEIFEYIP